MSQPRFDVYGIGNPLMDLLSHVSPHFLQSQQLETDRMYLVDQERQRQLLGELERLGYEMFSAPGGSAANTMIGLAQLGGSAAYTGKLGKDDLGALYQQKLEEGGVSTQLAYGAGISGSSLILVSESGSRTMNTFLGMCQELQPEDIVEEVMQQSRFLYIEGYLWDTEDQQEAVVRAIRLAKQHGTQVALSLSDPFCAQRHREAFHRLIREDVDLLFCNQEEAFSLLNTEISQEALEYLANHVQTVALTLGARGALICQQSEMFYVDPRNVKVIDTTGAGDAFAAGFLYALSRDKSAFECGILATAMAAEIIQQMGPRLTGDVQSRMRALFGDRF